MNHIKSLVLALTAVSLAACSGSKKENPKLDYQSANNKIVSLEVPPDLNARATAIYTACPEAQPPAPMR